MDNFNWGVRRRSMDSLDQSDLQPLEESQLSSSMPSLSKITHEDSDESSEEDSLIASQILSQSQLMVSLSPTAEISNRDSPSAFFYTSSADSTPLNTNNPNFDGQLPEDSKQRVNKGFRVSEILGTTHSYRNSILEFFTNFAK